MRDVDAIIGRTIAREGDDKYTNIAADSGGGTRYGISDTRDGVKDGMTDTNGDGRPDTRVADLTREQAVAIYKRDYYDAAKLDLVANDDVAAKVFDIAVNMGVRTAVKLLQQSIGATPDGAMGPATAALVNAEPSVKVINELRRRQLLHYVEIVRHDPQQMEFFSGWINRAFA